MKVSRGKVFERVLSGRCPNCGHFHIFRNWFRMKPHCPECEFCIEKDDSGFYLGTTSIGYVISTIFVILPMCILAAMDRLSVVLAIIYGFIGSVMLCLVMYPFLLTGMLAVYFAVAAEELPINSEISDETRI